MKIVILLKRLFLIAVLRKRAKANIILVRKIEYRGLGTVVLMMKKSPILKNIVEVFLYPLTLRKGRKFGKLVMREDVHLALYRKHIP